MISADSIVFYEKEEISRKKLAGGADASVCIGVYSLHSRR
jgi:hypothetical protein